MIVSVAEARKRFSELVRAAERGETVEVARYNGEPVVRIVAVRPPGPVPLPAGCVGPVDEAAIDAPLEDWGDDE